MFLHNTVLLVGFGWTNCKILRRFKDRGTEKNVTTRGWCTDEQVRTAHYVKKSDKMRARRIKNYCNSF